MADDGPVPLDLGNVGTNDAITTQSNQDASNDMSYDDMCAIALKGNTAGQRTARKDQMEQERGIVEKELMNGRLEKEMTEEIKEVKGLQGQQT